MGSPSDRSVTDGVPPTRNRSCRPVDSVQDIMRNHIIIKSIGITKHIIESKYINFNESSGIININEKIYPLILKSYMVSDFVFIGLIF